MEYEKISLGKGAPASPPDPGHAAGHGHGHGAGPGAPAGEAGGNRLVQMVWRGRWIILAFPLLFGAVAFAWVNDRVPGFPVIPRYRATARLVIEQREVNPLKDAGESTTKQRTMLRQQVALVKSDKLLKSLAATEGIDELRHFQNLGPRPLIGVLNDGLTARSDSNTDIVSISFESPFKRDAVWVVDAAVANFLEYHRQRRRERSEEVIALLEQDHEAKIQELSAIQTEIRDLKRAHAIGPQGTSLVSDRLEALSESLNAAHLSIFEAEAELDGIQSVEDDPVELIKYADKRRLETPISVLEDEIATFRKERQNLENDYARKSQQLSSEAPALVQLQERIDGLVERENAILLRYAEAFKNQAEIDVREKKRAAELLQERFDQLEAEVNEVNVALAQLELLENRRELMEEELTQWAARISELEVADESGALNIHPMGNARASSTPVYPNKLETMAYAVVLGLALGFGIVLLRGVRDRRIWTVEEVPELLGVSVLGVFPRMSGTSARTKVGRIIELEPGSLAAEAVRSVRTAASFGLPNDGRGIILVTSSVSNEGKSVTASNLALALAHAGRRTLLVDGDLRDPGQHDIFGVMGKVGMGDALGGSAPYKEGVSHNVAPNLDLLPAGNAIGKAAELVESPACRELLARIREDYDCVVLDSSPALETAETRVLASLADLVVFVMRLDVSTTPNARRALGILRSVGANVLGVMLNGYRTKRGAKSYAEGISYGYGSYGYGSGSTGGAPAVRASQPPARDLESAPDVRVASTDGGEREEPPKRGLEAWS